MKNTVSLLAGLVLLMGVSLAQTVALPPPGDQPPTQFAPNTLVAADLAKSLDAKKLKVGDPVEARTSVDMLSNGQIIMARNTKIVGHVTSVKAHSKESPDSTIGIAFDRFIMKDGRELPLKAMVQAVGSPLNNFGSEGAPVAPGGGMQQSGGGAGGGGSNGGSSGSSGGSRSGGSYGSQQPSYPSTGGLPPSGDGATNSARPNGALGATSQGVVGIKDLSLTATADSSVFASGTRNVHLDSATQLILKVQ
jgi:hypothetical protein